MFYRFHPDLVCDTIVGGHLPKRYWAIRISYCICSSYQE